VFAAGKNMPGGHTHQTSPADHPFLLALAGIAADSDMPIGLHMEAITTGAGQAPNIAALERLLAYNRLARIVWLHAGWDRTGQRATACRPESERWRCEILAAPASSSAIPKPKTDVASMKAWLCKSQVRCA